MNVIRAKTAGFCMGVSLALHKLDAQTEKAADGQIFTLGPIIHNPQVLEEYAAKGVKRINSPDEATIGGRVIIRAHGVPVEVEEQLQSRNVKVVDATCPKVKRAQTLIREQSRKGRRLLLFGEKDHPEVRGLLSYAGKDAVVFESLDSLDMEALQGDKPWFLAAQTTQDRGAFESVQELLRCRIDPDMPMLETICDATRERQAEAIAIARQAPAVVVVGGYASGNTRRLTAVVKEQGVYVAHVETADELPVQELQGFSRVGLTAGASTPRKIIDVVEEKLATL